MFPLIYLYLTLTTDPFLISFNCIFLISLEWTWNISNISSFEIGINNESLLKLFQNKIVSQHFLGELWWRSDEWYAGWWESTIGFLTLSSIPSFWSLPNLVKSNPLGSRKTLLILKSMYFFIFRILGEDAILKFVDAHNLGLSVPKIRARVCMFWHPVQSTTFPWSLSVSD